jgi:spore maturation protein CgeB
MMGRLRICIFAHSWISDWNHGNAHFLRGLAYELSRLGHDVLCCEETDSWSMANLLQEGFDRAAEAFRNFHKAFPTLNVRFYRNDASLLPFLEEQLREADVVMVHEWNDPKVADAILSLKSRLGFRALFHDTHHRAYTNPKEVLRMPLARFDGVLAFGEAIRRIYAEAFGVERVWTFHEGADTAHFRPLAHEKDTDVIWVGNWGDEERTRELEEFLIMPAGPLRDRKIAVHGVRYPRQALERLAEARIEFRGYLPNLEAPHAYARSALTVHVPRRFYANGLSGVPTIRVFEALACGVPLLCSPWVDTEGLFRAGEDYICVKDGRAMEAEIRNLLADEAARQQMANNAVETIGRRHTCAHRAAQLLEICEELGK